MQDGVQRTVKCTAEGLLIAGQGRESQTRQKAEESRSIKTQKTAEMFQKQAMPGRLGLLAV